jgi:hypothetical protein
MWYLDPWNYSKTLTIDHRLQSSACKQLMIVEQSVWIGTSVMLTRFKILEMNIGLNRLTVNNQRSMKIWLIKPTDDQWKNNSDKYRYITHKDLISRLLFIYLWTLNCPHPYQLTVHSMWHKSIEARSCWRRSGTHDWITVLLIISLCGSVLLARHSRSSLLHEYPNLVRCIRLSFIYTHAHNML